MSQWGTGGEQQIKSSSPDKTYVSDGDAGAAYRGGLPRDRIFPILQLSPMIAKTKRRRTIKHHLRIGSPFVCEREFQVRNVVCYANDRSTDSPLVYPPSWLRSVSHRGGLCEGEGMNEGGTRKMPGDCFLTFHLFRLGSLLSGSNRAHPLMDDLLRPGREPSLARVGVTVIRLDSISLIQTAGVNCRWATRNNYRPLELDIGNVQGDLRGEAEPEIDDAREAELMREDIFFKPVLGQSVESARKHRPLGRGEHSPPRRKSPTASADPDRNLR